MNDILLILGFMDAFTGAKKGSLKYYEKKLHEFQEQEAETLIDIGVIYMEKDDVENALNNFNEALKSYQKIEYEEGEAYTYDLIGDTYLTVRNTVSALVNYEKALEIYSSIQSPLEDEMKEKIAEVRQIHDSMEIDSDSNSFNNEFSPDRNYEGDYFDESALSDLDKTKPIVDASNNSDWIPLEELADKLKEPILLLENSESYLTYYNDSEGVEYLMEALSAAEVIEDVDGQGTLHLMIGDNDLRQENTSYALDHFNDARKIFRKNQNLKGEAISLLLMGAVFFVMDEKEEMYQVFKDSLNIFHELEYKTGESIAIDLIGMLSS